MERRLASGNIHEKSTQSGRQLESGLLKHSDHILPYLFPTQSSGYLEKTLDGALIIV